MLESLTKYAEGE